MHRVRASLGHLAFAAALAFGLAPSDALGGTGRIRASGGVNHVDFCVSIRFQATAAEIANIQRAFTDGSAVLADATDGQFRFGHVDIVNDSRASRQAEVWIINGTGRAFATCGSFGTPGTHITMYYNSNFVGAPAVAGDAYTVAHEFAHHLWGVKDEYSGPGPMGTTVAAECEPAPGANTANFCLMDNYFTRGGNIGAGGTGTYTLDELCTAGNHDPDTDTYQESRWRWCPASC